MGNDDAAVDWVKSLDILSGDRRCISCLAGMVIDIIIFVTGFAVKTKMIGSEEPWEGITSVVMVTPFDENDVFVLGWTLENDSIVVIHGKDHDLVIGEMTLKSSEFGQSTRSFGYTRLAMECLGLGLLKGSPSS